VSAAASPAAATVADLGVVVQAIRRRRRWALRPAAGGDRSARRLRPGVKLCSAWLVTLLACAVPGGRHASAVEVVRVKSPKTWFLPHDPDVLGRLRDQADTVAEVLTALAGWVRGEPVGGELHTPFLVQSSERREVLVAVREALSSPIGAEDVFELSERLGEIAEAAYALVRESELCRTPPDDHLKAMVLTSVTAFDMLHEALDLVPNDDAAGRADTAVSSLDFAEHAYRRAIAGLETEPDLRREMRLRELYRRAEHLASAVQRLGRRTWYAVGKPS
jgi:uncharacterized protein Yka (UPF0111/DUF47 family)